MPSVSKSRTMTWMPFGHRTSWMTPPWIVISTVFFIFAYFPQWLTVDANCGRSAISPVQVSSSNMMVRQGERSSSDGKIVIPTAWTCQSGLLQKIRLFILLLSLWITEIGELLTGEVFGLGDRGIWWLRLSAMCECCRHDSVSLETFGHGYSRRRITAFSPFVLQNTPLSGLVLRHHLSGVQTRL